MLTKNKPSVQLDISIENKNTFIVDERFIDVFRKQFCKTDLAGLKMDLKAVVEYAEDVESLINTLDERIYLHRIISHPNLNTPE